MKKALRRILIIATIFVAAGLAIWIIGMSVLGWDFERLDTTTYTAKQYSAGESAPITHIIIDVDSYPIQVTRGESVELKYYESTDSDVTITEEKGVLRVHERYRFDPFKNGMFNVGRSSHKYLLAVVSGVTFDITSNNGDVTFDGVDFETFEIDSTNLNLTFNDCHIGSMDVHATNADIELKQCTVNTVAVRGSNHDITLKNCKGASARFTGTNATVEATDCEYDSFSVDSTNPDVNITRGTYGTIKLHGTNGDFALKRVKAEIIDLSATNLDADVSILGIASEYSISSSGKHLPSSRTGSTNKKISFKGTNNDVELKFVS